MAIRSALAGAAVVATVVTITACAQSDAPGTQSQADGPLFSPPTSTAAASPPTADEVVVQIEGTGYTCESLMKLLEPAVRLGEGCNAPLQAAFERWSGRIPIFLDSRLLDSALRRIEGAADSLNQPEFSPALLAGYAVLACDFSDRLTYEGEPADLTMKAAAFVQTFNAQFADVESEGLLHLYLAATNELCPETLG